MNDGYHGVLLVNKPLRMSSHDAVGEVRRAVGQRRVGHTGTLDPLADGLLVMCLGRATKIARHLSGRDKVYLAEIHLGLTSSTYDAEGLDPDQSPSEVPDLTVVELDSRLERFRGHIKQTVPAYSAVQVDGQRLYKLARKGHAVELPEREVDIHRLEIISFAPPILKLKVTCSSGTYIRTLAHDIGQELGCGAYLSQLRRESVGDLHLRDALTPENLRRSHESGELSDRLLRIDQVLGMGAVIVQASFADRIVTGPPLRSDDVASIERPFDSGETILLKNEQGLALATGRARVASDEFTRADGDLFDYERVLN